MFASDRTATVDVPEQLAGMPGQRVTIRGLSRRSFEDARVIAVRRGIERLGSDRLAQLVREHGDEALELAKENPALGYDWPTLIERSVIEWRPPRPAPLPESELEAWLARAIVEHSQPKGSR